MSISDLTEFILYVLPGFIALQIYHKIYPAKQKSDLIYISWSIILGIVITNIILLIDKNYLGKQLYPELTEFPGFLFILCIIASGIVFGLLFSLSHELRYKIGIKYGWKFLIPDSLSIWAKINQKWNKDWAVVYLEDKSIYLGNIKYYSYDPNNSDHDLLLGQAKRVDNELKVQYKINGIGVYINTRDIKKIEFLAGEKKSI